MRENGCFPPGTDIKKILEFYFQVTFATASLLLPRKQRIEIYNKHFFVLVLQGKDCNNVSSVFVCQISSLEMTCESNAVMAATLANNGTCPITGERVLQVDAVNHVIALMYSCGMSISSGQFAFNVGLCS